MVSCRLLNKYIGLSNDPEPLPPLRDLKGLLNLILISYSDDFVTTLDEQTLVGILSGCPHLEILSCDGNFRNYFKDAFVSRLLRVNSFQHLRILDMNGLSSFTSELTYDSAEKFLRLPVIQEFRFTQWILTVPEYKQLLGLVCENRWEVKLVASRSLMYAITCEEEADAENQN